MQEVLEIKTIDDLERILLQRPDWKERIRKLILTERLIDLPATFDNFVENDFNPLKDKVDRLSDDVSVLKQDVAVLKQDVGELKGDVLEIKFQNKIGSYLGRLLSKVRLVDPSKLADALYEALDKGIITEQDVDDTLLVDAVAEGYLRKPEPKKVLVAVEVSNVIDKNDVLRVFKRANIIFKVYNTQCIPIAYGNKLTSGAKDLAEQNGVLLIGKS